MFVKQTPFPAVERTEMEVAGHGSGSGGVLVPKYLSAHYGWKTLTHLGKRLRRVVLCSC
mgnify:CR=1 FL=1